MDIGIITYHYSYNFGAMIQAYALRRALIDMTGDNCHVEIINYMPPTFHNKGEDIRNEMFLIQKKERNRFLKERCGISEEPETDIGKIKEYDIYITGSDQVWNPNLPVFEKTSEYFLDFVDDSKIRASYAASIGEKITENFSKDLFEQNIPKFDFLSVRERSYCEFIEQFTDKKCEAVLDPTFLLHRDDYLKMIPDTPKKERYTLCVAYAMKAKRKLYDLANRYTIINKQNVVDMEERVKPYLFMNPERTIAFSSMEEIIWNICNADMIMTDSFHFVVFSIIFHRPFYVMLTGKPSRITDLLALLGLENRIITDNMRLSDLNTNIDYQEVEEKIEFSREKSLEYLKKVIEGKK